MGVHSGTHIDAPLHFLPSGKTIDGMDINFSIGHVDCSYNVSGENHVRRYRGAQSTAGDPSSAFPNKEFRFLEAISALISDRFRRLDRVPRQMLGRKRH
jgi:hypothetical protein